MTDQTTAFSKADRKAANIAAHEARNAASKAKAAKRREARIADHKQRNLEAQEGRMLRAKFSGARIDAAEPVSIQLSRWTPGNLADAYLDEDDGGHILSGFMIEINGRPASVEDIVVPEGLVEHADESLDEAGELYADVVRGADGRLMLVSVMGNGGTYDADGDFTELA